ncbi:MAG: Holliday junction resolvase RuvX [Saccharofermentanales bacterium]|jgi:putative Holliday junction resolvase|nr:Holliday junction resolvase RuvX [Bacillota bacterium]
MTMGRIMGIDYGSRRVGIALSDPLGILASGLETIQRRGEDDSSVIRRIAELCTAHEVKRIILGLPRRTDGKSGEAERSARDFAAGLAEATGLEVIFADERYTTVLAGRIMREAGIKRDKRRALVDQIAAEIILQDWLDQNRKKQKSQ